LFRFHPVLKEGQEVPLESFARLQHVRTGYWLGDAEGKPYESKQFAAMHATPVRTHAPAPTLAVRAHRELTAALTARRPCWQSQGKEESMESLAWDDAKLYQIAAVVEPRYDDVYAIVPVAPNTLLDFNYLMGLLPIVDNFIRRTNSGRTITTDLSHADSTVRRAGMAGRHKLRWLTRCRAPSSQVARVVA